LRLKRPKSYAIVFAGTIPANYFQIKDYRQKTAFAGTLVKDTEKQIFCQAVAEKK